MDDIIAALTKPLTEDEKSPKTKGRHPGSYIRDLEEVNPSLQKSLMMFTHRPPTEEKVTEMLTGTDLPSDHLVAKIIPRLGKATIEKIAINAVMAGALPTYMSLLIAGVQAVMDPIANFGTTEVSTASWSPFWITNGPIRHDIHVNCREGMFSPGDIANAAIGRAMGFIIKNIGGARKGIEDMGIFGNPGKYTMVAAENEEASPWEPLHVEHGFKKEDSTITVSFPTSFTLAGVFTSDAEGIMRSIVSAMTSAPGGGVTVILQPLHARTLGDDGWTKKEIEEYVYNYARIPAYRTSTYWSKLVPGRGRERARIPLNPEDHVPSLPC
jgi:hypothetical protein